MNRIIPYLQKGVDVASGEKSDVAYYTFSGTIVLDRTGDWPDYAEKQPVQTRSFMLTVPRDQIVFDPWKQALGSQAVLAAISAVMGEFEHNPPKRPNGAQPRIQGVN